MVSQEWSYCKYWKNMCNIISFLPGKPHTMFNRNTISYSSELIFLGIFITENLAWHVQIHSICSSMSKAYYIIKSLRDIMSTHMLWSIYFAYFRSQLTYGILFWGSDGETIKVFLLQEKMIWVLTGVHKHESRRHIFRKFWIITLTSLYILEVLWFIKKCKGHLKQNCRIHDHNTRNKWDLHTRYCNTVLYKWSVTNISIKLFNKLPVQIKQLDNYKCFKRE